MSSSEDTSDTDNVEELKLQVIALKQKIKDLTIQLGEALRNQSSATDSTTVTDTIAVSTSPAQSSNPAKSKDPSQTQPSNAQMEQLTLMLDIAEQVTQQ